MSTVPSTTPRNRETMIVAIVAVCALILGVAVQVIFPPAPRALIVMGDTGGFSAEASVDSGVMVDYDYVAGPGLSGDGGTGTVYELQLLGDPLDLLAGLGDAFGVEGEPTRSQYFDEMWPGYVLGPEDWSGPTLNVTWSGTGPWYYSNPAAYQDPVCREIPAEEGSEGEPGFECENPEPLGPVPSVDEATAMAQELLAAAGFDMEASALTVLADDDWGVGLSAIQRVEGLDTALEWSVFFGPGPTLASVSGHAATPVSRGTFTTISPHSALERLESGQWWGSPAPLYHSDFHGVLEGEVTLEEPTFPEPGDIITVQVDSAEFSPLLVWDASGTAWIVPGYVMRHGPEPWNASAVISVEDGVIVLPEPMMVDIMPLSEGE